MGRNTGGVYSLPGSDFVTGTVIQSNAMNSKFNDVATALTDSLSRTGNGDMLAPIRVPDGSAAIPSFSWSSDIGTGFYLAATSSFRAVILASTVQEWTNTSVAINKPLMITGATTVTGNLTLTGSVLTGLTVTNSTTNGVGVTSTGNGTGAGVVATGGATGHGGTFSGGASGGRGINATATGNNIGAVIAGSGTGNGVNVTGGAPAGATGGYGIHATGGTPSSGNASGGAGGYFIGGAKSGTGTDGPGVIAAAGAGSGPLGRTIAIQSLNGDISLDGVTAPNSNVPIKNSVTPSNIVKAWAVLSVSGGVITVNGGFNIGTPSFVTVAGNANHGISIPYASGGEMNGSYAATISIQPSLPAAALRVPIIVTAGNASVSFAVHDSAGSTNALNAFSAVYYVVVVGPQ